MGPSPVLSISHKDTIGTMLNFNGGNGLGLKTLHVNRPLYFVHVLLFVSTRIKAGSFARILFTFALILYRMCVCGYWV